MSLTKRPRGATDPQVQQHEDVGPSAGMVRQSSPVGGEEEGPCSSRHNTAAVCCQVPGCTASLAGTKQYYSRYRICVSHSTMQAVDLGGGDLRRFCQLCGRFHLLVCFDDNRRSCRERLAKNNARRRKGAPVRVSNGRSRRRPARFARPKSDCDTSTDESEVQSSSGDSRIQSTGQPKAPDSTTSTCRLQQQGNEALDLDCGGLTLVPFMHGDVDMTMAAAAPIASARPQQHQQQQQRPCSLTHAVPMSITPAASMLQPEASVALPSIFSTLHSLEVLACNQTSQAGSEPQGSPALHCGSLVLAPMPTLPDGPLVDDAQSPLFPPHTSPLMRPQHYSSPCSHADGRAFFMQSQPVPVLTRQPMSWPRLSNMDVGYWAGAEQCNALSGPLATYEAAPAFRSSRLGAAYASQPSSYAPFDAPVAPAEPFIRSLAGQDSLQALWETLV